MMPITDAEHLQEWLEWNATKEVISKEKYYNRIKHGEIVWDDSVSHTFYCNSWDDVIKFIASSASQAAEYSLVTLNDRDNLNNIPHAEIGEHRVATISPYNDGVQVTTQTFERHETSSFHKNPDIELQFPGMLTLMYSQDYFRGMSDVHIVCDYVPLESLMAHGCHFGGYDWFSDHPTGNSNTPDSDVA